MTVFDNRPLLGGLTTYGIAEYKLRPSDSLKEVELIRKLGVEFRKAEVGTDITLEELEQSFSLVFLGMGLGAMQRLGIPGEDARGVIDALHFIERYKTDPDFPVGSVVAVLGGGNTALDAANAARRLEADEVHVFYRRTEEEMPAFPFEYDHSRLEGVYFHWLSQPVEILSKDGRAVGVRFTRTRLGKPDATGRRNATPVPGSDFEFTCDMVIPALGQGRLMEVLRATRGVEISGGSISVDRPTGRTANPKYFAGGDCVNGGREVVDAVADGKRRRWPWPGSLQRHEGVRHGRAIDTVHGHPHSQPVLACIRSSDKQRRADPAGVRRRLGRRGMENHRGAHREHRLALLLGGLERAAHDGAEQHRADLRPAH